MSDIIDPEELRLGDLLFLKEKGKIRLVSHLALALNANQVFHFNRSKVNIESTEKVFQIYEQAIQSDLLQYIDYRNTNYRDRFGIFLP